MRWLVMPSVGSCLSVPKVGPSANGAILISQTVGQGGRNLPDDVRTIQDALNQVTVVGGTGGAFPFLTVDGICGPKTNAAIAKFQQVQLQIFDGLIEPGRKTILRINEILDPVSTDDLNVKITAALPLVVASLSAALANLQAVIAGSAGTAPAAKAADRLNRHFRINTLSASDQSTARVDLFRTYTRFATVMGKPELFNIAATDEFDLDRQNAKIALTRSQGFFEEGEVDPDNGKRLDHIHLGFGFFAASVTPEFAAFIILHELSHFVGHSDGSEIEDHGRGWFNDVFIQPLSAQKRLTNADSYAGFAHECRVNNPTKPTFVRTAPGGLGGAR